VQVRLGVDIACRAAHRAACADQTGRIVWSGHQFRPRAEDLEALWDRLPGDATEVLVVLEPTRNAWVPLAAWFRSHGATVVLVPAEQSADLRAYYAKHTKTDRLDAELLARLPLLHPDGLHPETTNGPGDPLKRAVKLRSGLVRRRTACMQRLDALLEILGPDWVAALGSDMTQTAFKFLAGWANPTRSSASAGPGWPAGSSARPARPGASGEPTRSSPPPRPPWRCGDPPAWTMRLWPPTSPPRPASRWSSRVRSPALMSGSSTTTATPTPTTSCCRCRVWGRSLPARSAAASATPSGSPAWPRPGPSPD
jgi:Transposase